jgi:hypothetical protein
MTPRSTLVTSQLELYRKGLSSEVREAPKHPRQSRTTGVLHRITTVLDRQRSYNTTGTEIVD